MRLRDARLVDKADFDRVFADNHRARTDFAMVMAERERIDLLIIGMGISMARPPKLVRDGLTAAGLSIDPMATGHAIATYNLLIGERRKVAAALIAVDHAG